MRRLIGPVLIGAGVFLIVAAALVRFYAVPTLTKVPSGYNSVTNLEATGAEIFNSDPEVLAPETHDLVITSNTREDADADAPDGVAVWVNATVVDKATGGNFQKTTERVAFDDSSGAGVDCDSCDTWIAASDGETVEEVPTTFEGQIYKFPFNTQKKSYDVWDGSVGEAVPATYEGEDKVNGLDVYKFVQVIEPTIIEQRDIPGSVFGSDEPTVTADMSYAMTRTFYVEPVTGAPVHRVDDRVQELVYDGVRVPAFVGNVHYTDAQVDENVSDVETRAKLLGGARLLYPLLAALLGVLMLGLGLVLNRRFADDSTEVDQEDRPLVTA
ncbi:hypothetical protein DJ010_05935 [Nocardioides silvaticus]|uniref:DUF3068 domain-containing protein n=1 Tax=Nocardioides silvaticus TaxID=2201891 RepID=A0A316TGF7_9ACTN|nr:DUF3068 domain-containing protein [Nocardioides silvaticus]PWN03633.1 hypothetical protein DJ010_05935 [Nocardioides silvaticus]